MKTLFNTIGLMGRIRHEATRQTFLSLIGQLNALNVNLIIEENIAQQLKNTTLPCASKAVLSQKSDLIIVVGGDGCLLEAARIAVVDDTPLIGVNRGRLGFLADLAPDTLDETIPAILQGHYIEENRFLLEAEINKGEICGCALNDIVLASGNTAHMTEFEVYVDGKFMCSERSDGLIIATPTGSTAYALSGGGPILHPSLNAITLVPMFSHTLNSRPIVLNADMTINILIGTQIAASPQLSCDGHIVAKLAAQQKITIRKKKRPLRLLHPTHYRYFRNLGQKLHWGKKLVSPTQEW
jgi:NAD+ kinase